MERDQQFKRILAHLYEAMLDDSLWPTTAALIDEAVGIKGNHLVVAEGLDFYFQQLTYRGERREELERWFEGVAHRDVRLPRLSGLPHGRLVPVSDLYTEQEIKTSFGFNEVLVLGEAQNGLNVRMDGEDGLSIVWVLADPLESGLEATSWNSDQLSMLDALLPHIRQFVRVHQALANAEATGATLVGLLDQADVGVVHLDSKGRMVFANAPADAVLSRGDGLRGTKGRQLAAGLKADDTRLQKLLAAALPRRGGRGLSDSMMVHRWPDGRYTLHICPVEPRDGTRGVSGLATVAAVVLIVDPAAGPRLDPERVSTVLGLTWSEAQVAAALAEGSSVRDIAAAIHRAESTVRWTIKRIHAKLNVTRQADVVRMVLSATGGVLGAG